MPGRLGPRFAIEALFLIALAVGAAYADLDARWIVLVMAGGWLVVSLLELTAERIWAALPPWRRPNYARAAQPPVRESAPVDEAEPQPEAQREDEAATVIAPPVHVPPPVAAPAPVESEPEPEPEPEPQPVQEPEPERAPEPAAAVPTRPRLEPLQARPRRRWFRRDRSEPEQLPPRELPKHVRLLPTTRDQSRASEEVAEIFDAPEREERRGR